MDDRRPDDPYKRYGHASNEIENRPEDSNPMPQPDNNDVNFHIEADDSPTFLENNSRDEEIGAEIAPEEARRDDRDRGDHNEIPNQTIGWVGLALSILSFFIMPIILGAAGIIVGFMARNRGMEWLGYAAIALGAIAIIARLFFYPVAY